MSTPNHNRGFAIPASEPDGNHGSHSARTSHSSRNTAAEPRAEGRLLSLLSILLCRRSRRKTALSNNIHFNNHRVEDSVHVAIKHDQEAHQRKGEPAASYTPRAPLSERVAAARRLEATRKEASHGTHKHAIVCTEAGNAIVSTEEEEESEIDKDILAAVSMSESVSGSAAVDVLGG